MSTDRSRAGRWPEIDLARLPSLPLSELHELWRMHFRTSKPPPKRRLLVRELAYAVQSERAGGVDAETRRLLDAAVRLALRGAKHRDGAAAAAATRPGGDDDDASADEPGARSMPRRPKPALARTRAPTLPAAAKLVRVWNGRRHEVTVVEGGRSFVYRGTTYRSLTAVARVITGTEWSGPRFFGLAAKGAKP